MSHEIPIYCNSLPQKEEFFSRLPAVAPPRPPYQLTKINLVDFVSCYQIYSDWQQGKIPEERKKQLFQHYFNFILMSRLFGASSDPLTQWVVETGSPQDRHLVSTAYFYALTVNFCYNFYSRNTFLGLLEHSLESVKTFQTFLDTFEEQIKNQAAKMDKGKWEQKWEQMDAPKPPFPEYLYQQAKHSIHKEEERMDRIFKRLDALQLDLKADLLRDCFISLLVIT